MKLRAFGARVLIKRDSAKKESITKGGIIIPDNRQVNKPAFSGTILDVGGYCEMEFKDSQGKARRLKRGDRVIFGLYSPGMELDRINHGDKPEYEGILLMAEDDICVILEEGESNLNIEENENA